MRVRRLLAVLAALLAALPCAGRAAPVRVVDLASPFAARSPWRVVVTQGPPAPSPGGAGLEPGAITLCLQRSPGGPCDPELRNQLRPPVLPDDDFAVPHYLHALDLVAAPRVGRLLLVRTASDHSGDGDQVRLLQLLAYDRARDRFRRVYAQATGRNNNQEIRYFASGPLAGTAVAVEPTTDAPFGYHVTVSRDDGRAFTPVMRFRSATRYADGNTLPVIDAELPTIERRLGLWHAGEPLPHPPGCVRPRLRHDELWCG